MTHPIADDMTATKRAAHTTQVEVTDAQLTAAYLAWCKTNGTPESFARAILALRPEQSGLTGCNCRWDGDTQVQWCELHLAHKDAIHEWAERAKEAEKQLALRPEPGVSRNPFASRCYTMSESHLSGHRLIVGFEKLVDAQDAHEWVTRQGRGDFTHPAPSVPADVVRVPVQVLKDASEALGNFVSDHGWGDADMQAMDNLDAYIARHEAKDAK